MNAIIFGANGQDGYYLNKLLVKEQYKVIQVSRSGGGSEGEILAGDICNRSLVEALMRDCKPELIFDLAANSTTHHSSLFENHETISTGTINILEAVKDFSPGSKVFLAGSGLQFKNNGNAISEKCEFEASSGYAVSRIQSVYAARYFRSLGIKAYVGYLFHHESPFRPERHVSKKIANAVKKIAIGGQKKLQLGDISVEKEWGFAEDIAHGMFALINQEQVSEATIGTGVAYSIENWLEKCFGAIGADWRKFVQFEEPQENRKFKLVSDTKTMNSIGWSASTDIDKLAEIMLSQ
jgi:GDPmannose 4,6-dehydratase